MDHLGELYKAALDRIFEMMKYRGLNQKQLAEALGVSPQTITDWKKDNSRSFMSGPVILELSRVLGSPIGYLIWGDGAKTTEEDSQTPKVPLKDRIDEPYLTDMEKKILLAYRHADRHIQVIVETALSPYMKSQKTTSATG